MAKWDCSCSSSLDRFFLSLYSVKDIKESTDKAKTLGANVIVEPTAIPKGGHYSILIDPTGASIGFYQPGSSS